MRLWFLCIALVTSFQASRALPLRKNVNKNEFTNFWLFTHRFLSSVATNIKNRQGTVRLENSRNAQPILESANKPTAQQGFDQAEPPKASKKADKYGEKHKSRVPTSKIRKYDRQHKSDFVYRYSIPKRRIRKVMKLLRNEVLGYWNTLGKILEPLQGASTDHLDDDFPIYNKIATTSISVTIPPQNEAERVPIVKNYQFKKRGIFGILSSKTNDKASKSHENIALIEEERPDEHNIPIVKEKSVDDSHIDIVASSKNQSGIDSHKIPITNPKKLN